MAYYSVDEVESAIASLASTYPNSCQLIELQNRTIEGRAIHAREWGGSEICIYLAADLLEAYKRKTGLKYKGDGGGKYFTADQVQSVVEDLNVLLVPCINPDGRHYSQTVESLWRRNRNPAKSGGNPDCVGVDLNRNYDFLWNFKNLFSPDAVVRTSDDPCDQNQTYCGPSPFSELETQNVKWLLDKYPTVKFHVDIHSYSELILYCWGDDQYQSDDPQQNFTNPTYNRKRGIRNDEAYKEYVPKVDMDTAKDLANHIYDGIRAVNHNEYAVESAFDL